MSWLPQGHCQEPSERFSKLSLTQSTVNFTSSSISAPLLPPSCLEVGATCAKAALLVGDQLPVLEFPLPSPYSSQPIMPHHSQSDLMPRIPVALVLWVVLCPFEVGVALNVFSPTRKTVIP